MFLTKDEPFLGVHIGDSLLACLKSHVKSRNHYEKTWKKQLDRARGIPQEVHPGRLTWNLLTNHLERKMIFQTSMVMFHVNLPGCSLDGQSTALRPPRTGIRSAIPWKTQLKVPRHPPTHSKELVYLHTKTGVVWGILRVDLGKYIHTNIHWGYWGWKIAVGLFLILPGWRLTFWGEKRGRSQLQELIFSG